MSALILPNLLALCDMCIYLFATTEKRLKHIQSPDAQNRMTDDVFDI